jgi:arylsulfatase A-like enzyme
MRTTRIALALTLAVVGASHAADDPPPPKRPNVLFIAIDDMRSELGCYGSPIVKSPNIDALAKSGVMFTWAYCSQAVCSPSRVSLLTGRRPDTTRVWDLVTPMRQTMPNVVTLPQQFKDHGYYTLAIGKIYHGTFPDPASWTIGDQLKPARTEAYSADVQARLNARKQQMKAEGQPQAAITGTRGPATDDPDVADNALNDGAVCDVAVDTLKALKDRHEPWFFGVGFIRPHLPFVAPKRYWDLYDPKSITLAPNQAPPTGVTPYSLSGLGELRSYMDMKDIKDPPAVIDEARQRRLKHGYYAAISYTDALIGRLLAQLDALGLAQNTIVVLWSDHGWKLGEHAGWQKHSNFENDTNAPLIVRMPGAKGNGRAVTSSFVEFIDIYPTLCDLAGLPMPEGLEGRSFRPLLDDPAAAHKPAAISQYPRNLAGGVRVMGYALRTDRYRYIEWLDRATLEIVARELYDHASDPQENTNAAADPGLRDTIDSLSRQLWSTIPRPKPMNPAARKAAAKRAA